MDNESKYTKDVSSFKFHIDIQCSCNINLNKKFLIYVKEAKKSDIIEEDKYSGLMT